MVPLSRNWDLRGHSGHRAGYFLLGILLIVLLSLTYFQKIESLSAVALQVKHAEADSQQKDQLPVEPAPQQNKQPPVESPPEESPRESFVKNVLATPFQSPDDFSAIQKTCSAKMWPNDVVFECNWIVGGICNVRQEFFACIRWAIESGAGLILPKINPRVELTEGEPVLNEWGDPIELDVLFNRKGIISNLHNACPQMAVYNSVEEVPGPGTIQRVGKIHSRPRKNRPWMAWISENRAPVGKVSLVTYPHTLSEYEVCTDGPEFSNALGRLLPFREDVIQLAAVVLYELSAQFNLDFDVSKPINEKKFIGMHLRTSADAIEQGWTSFDTQASLYRNLSLTYDTPTVYIASGNLTSISLFAESVHPQMKVVHKSSILKGEDLASLEAMTWDQQGMVDYLVLLRASRFLGVSDSSFSWNLAVARRAVGKNGLCGKHKEDKSIHGSIRGSVTYSDEFSVIVGGKNKYDFEHRFWP